MNKIDFEKCNLYKFIIISNNIKVYEGVFNEKSWNKSIESGKLWEYINNRVLEKNIDLTIDFESSILENDIIKINAYNNDAKNKTDIDLSSILEKLEKTIQERKINLPENSYTTLLFTKGEDKILKKLGEEAIELILAKNNDKEIIYETSDLIYHILVYLVYKGISFDKVLLELNNRMK